jgi:hypothetical protein
MWRLSRIASVAALTVCPGLHAQTTRVLFIGNSYVYTNDLPSVFTQFALGMGDTVLAASSALGGYTLHQHSTYAPTLSAIAAQEWDFVVIQEQSQLPSSPPAQVASDVLPFAEAIADSVRSHHPCAEVVFMMTWGRENGDAMNCASWPPVCTYEGMQLQLRAGYLSMAQQNSAWCAPVGMAWREVRSTAPSLPLYQPDGSHPALNGTYLAASVLYSTLFGAGSAANPYTAGINSVDAALMRDIASLTVLDSLSTWNIGVNDPDAAFNPSFATPANGSVTFEPLHSGGTHVWQFGDGSMSSDEQPTHAYTAGGLYTVTHVVTDSCGRTDSTSMEVNVVITGIAGHQESTVPIRVLRAEGHVELHFDHDLPGVFELIDLAGRPVFRAELEGGLGCTIVPMQRDDLLLLWRHVERDGRVSSGKTIFVARP